MVDGNFERLKRTPAYREVEESIRAKILDGSLAQGDLLPAETDLAVQLGVTRPTVREALRGLENAGLIKRGARRRMVVTAPSPHIVRDAMHHAIVLHAITYRELWEVNMALEPAAAGLAAERITSDVLAEIETNLQRTADCLADPEELAKADIEFHELIARAAGNHAMLLAREPLGEPLFLAYGTVTRKIGPGERLLEAHWRIFEAVRNGDAETARKWMAKHIVDFRRGCEVAGLDLDEPVTNGAVRGTTV